MAGRTKRLIEQVLARHPGKGEVVVLSAEQQEKAKQSLDKLMEDLQQMSPRERSESLRVFGALSGDVGKELCLFRQSRQAALARSLTRAG